MRAIAQTGDADGRSLIQLKAVDGAYPLIGQMALAPAMPLHDALGCDEQACGAVVEDTLLPRLKRRIGDTIRIGGQEFRLKATIISEPDRVAGGFTLGPRVLI